MPTIEADGSSNVAFVEAIRTAAVDARAGIAVSDRCAGAAASALSIGSGLRDECVATKAIARRRLARTSATANRASGSAPNA